MCLQKVFEGWLILSLTVCILRNEGLSVFSLLTVVSRILFFVQKLLNSVIGLCNPSVEVFLLFLQFLMCVVCYTPCARQNSVQLFDSLPDLHVVSSLLLHSANEPLDLDFSFVIGW